MRKSILGLGLILALSFNGVGERQAAAAPPGRPSAAVPGSAIVQTALRYLGYPYTTVGNSPSLGFSCIGFVSYVYQSNGIPLPDDLWDAMAYSPQIPFSDLQPGDILYFQNTVWAGLSHTAIYIGGGRFVQAEWYNRGVVISSFTNDPIDGNYWQDHYLGANRPWSTAPAPPATPAQPSSSSQSALHSGPRARVSVLGLNIRIRPSLQGAVRALVTQGTSVVVLKQYRKWYWVQLPNGDFGWAFGPGIGKGIASFLGNRPFSRPQTVASVQVDALDVRARPGLQAPVVGAVYNGQKLHVYKRWNGWAWVTSSDGTLGWVKGDYVAHPANTSSSSAKSLGELRLEALKSIFSHQGSTGKQGKQRTASVSVNVRTAPSSGGVIVDLIPPGGSYRILNRVRGWARVQLPDGTKGYASLRVLSGGAQSRRSFGRHVSSSGRSRRVPVLTAGVRLRVRPGLHSAVLGLAAPGTRVHILNHRGKWLRVRLPGGRVGYVFRVFVRRQPAQ